jgi:hypothetical protein
MPSPETSQWLTMAISVPLTGFLVYRRFKRTFGKQPIKRRSMIGRSVVLSFIALVLVVTMPTLPMFAAAAGGLLFGTLAALYGFKKTVFDITEQGRFYTPDKWVGLAMTSIFLGRMVSRLLVLQQVGAFDPADGPPAQLPRSPLTTGAFWLWSVYYVVFFALVLRHDSRATPSPVKAPDAPAGAAPR